MRAIETYEHIQIPESYGLYASDIAQIESICKKERQTAIYMHLI